MKTTIRPQVVLAALAISVATISASAFAEAPPAEVTVRGEALSAEALKDKPVVTLANLLAKPEQFEGKTVVATGTVRQVCQKKGCWMELAKDKTSVGARVTFKDYAFFVPKDASGLEARVLATVKVAVLSDERAKHYEAEGATVPRGADGKPREVQLVASGVELKKAQK